ncbi:Intersectin 1 (SH3 domain protein) [Balamuthia mandrillaris]
MASGQPIGLAEVVFAWTGKTGEGSKDLSIQPGQTVTVYQKFNNGWWVGSIHDSNGTPGRKGIFPGSYVRETATFDGAPAKTNYGQKSVNHRHSLAVNQSTSSSASPSQRCKAIKTFNGTGNQLSFKPGDIIQIETRYPTGWWKGTIVSSTSPSPSSGLFPKDHVVLLCGEGDEVEVPHNNKAKNDVLFNKSDGYLLDIKRGGTTVSPIRPPRKDLNKESKPPQMPPTEEDVHKTNVVKKEKAAEQEGEAKPPTEPTEAGVTAIALYDFQGLSDTELSLSVGTLIRVLERKENTGGWWKGELMDTGRQGFFPASYVELVDEADGKKDAEDATEEAASRPDSPLAGASSSSSEKAEVVCKVKALYDYEGTTESELSFKAGELLSVFDNTGGEDSWWLGYLESDLLRREGHFPASYVTTDLSLARTEEPQTTTASANDCKQEQQEPGKQENEEAETKQVKGTPFRAVFVQDYVGKTASELTAFTGDAVLVVEKLSETGWWKGELAIGGSVGHFPSSFVRVEDETTAGDEGRAQKEDALQRTTSATTDIPTERDSARTRREREEREQAEQETRRSQDTKAEDEKQKKEKPPKKTKGKKAKGKKSTEGQRGKKDAKPDERKKIKKRPKKEKALASSSSSDRHKAIAGKQSKSDAATSSSSSMTSASASSSSEPQNHSNNTFSTTTTTPTAKVLWPYDAQAESELSIVEGEVVQVLEMPPGEWWLGEKKGGRIGHFPKAFVELVVPASPSTYSLETVSSSSVSSTASSRELSTVTVSSSQALKDSTKKKKKKSKKASSAVSSSTSTPRLQTFSSAVVQSGGPISSEWSTQMKEMTKALEEMRKELHANKLQQQQQQRALQHQQQHGEEAMAIITQLRELLAQETMQRMKLMEEVAALRHQVNRNSELEQRIDELSIQVQTSASAATAATFVLQQRPAPEQQLDGQETVRRLEAQLQDLRSNVEEEKLQRKQEEEKYAHLRKQIDELSQKQEDLLNRRQGRQPLSVSRGPLPRPPLPYPPVAPSASSAPPPSSSSITSDSSPLPSQSSSSLSTTPSSSPSLLSSSSSFAGVEKRLDVLDEAQRNETRARRELEVLHRKIESDVEKMAVEMKKLVRSVEDLQPKPNTFQLKKTGRDLYERDFYDDGL